METYLVIWIVCAIAGALIAQSKGRSPIGGAVLGLLLSVIGVLIVACWSKAPTPAATQTPKDVTAAKPPETLKPKD